MSPTQLQIKVNALKRLIKEKSLYDQEVLEQENFVNHMKATNADEYEIKKQLQVLQESQMMIPELNDKITEHRKELQKFVESYSGDEDFTEAKSLLNN